MTAMVFALMIGLALPQAGPTVEVEIDAQNFVLGDLVRLSSTDPRAGVALGRSPEPGLARRLNSYEIEGKVRAADLPTEGLNLPAVFLVRRLAGVLDGERVRNAVMTAFEDRFPGALIEIIEMTIPPTEVATGPIDISASLPPNFRPTSPVSVRVQAKSEGFARSFFVRTRARVQTLQPLLARDIDAQSPVRESDLRWEMAPLANVGDEFQGVDSLEGLVAKRDLREGEILTERMLYSPILVRRGEAVSVEVRVGGVKVSAVMSANGAGQYGDTIVVEHLDGSGRTNARVTGPGTVEAIFLHR